MALPGTTVTKQDGALGLVSAPADVPLVIGPSSGATKETKFRISQIGDLADNIGHGPAQDLASIILASNGGSVDVIVANASIAARVNTVTTSSNPNVTVTGTPYNTFDFEAEITSAGSAGAGKFRYSLDGGETYTDPLTIPTNGTSSIANTGLTLEWASGTHTLAKTITFTTEAPQMNSTNLVNCINVYTSASITPPFIAIANDTESAVSGSSLADALDAQLVSLEETYEIFCEGVCPTGGVDAGTTATLSAFSTVESSTGIGLNVVAERARKLIPLPIMGRGNPRLPFAYAFAERLQGVDISTSPARVVDGKLTGWSDPSYDEFLDGNEYHDAKIIAPRTFQGYGGIYVNQSFLKSAPGSDYKYTEWSRVINRAAQVANAGLKKYINRNVRVKTDGTGNIDERDALLIESDLQGQLNAAIMQELNADNKPGHASGVLFSVVRTNNLLTTSKLICTVVLVPLGKITNVDLRISFTTSIPVAAVAA